MRRLVVILALVGCAKKAPPPTPVGTPSPDAAVAIVDAAPPVLGDGPHDYRGTLAKATSIAMHLVRAGTRLTGAYAYSQFGKPIGLEGAVAPDGSIALDELLGDKVTGHLALRPDGRNLVGTWSDLARTRTLPVTLAPSPPLAALLLDAGLAPGLNRRAEQCLADVGCAADEAERLFVAADAAGEDDFDCARWLDGVGVKKDVVHGRACYERIAGHASCYGGSPDLALAQLLALRIDGIGGPRDVAGARTMLASCFEDATVMGLRAHADEVAANPSAPGLAVDFCKEIGGTQLVFNDCALRTRSHEHERASLLAKKAAAHLDATGRTLFLSAAKAFDAYVLADSQHVLAAYAGASVRYVVALGREDGLDAERAKDLAGFETFTAPAVTAEDLTRVRAENEKALGAAAPDPSLPPEDRAREQKALDGAQKAWVRYRDAELALHAHVFGPAQGVAHVRDAMTVLLTDRRTKVCAAPSLGQ